ncbi:MAG TPA: transcription-repair coupling factor, partial [Gemmatimonadales bacterium]|nr:transcription-repair coupling factor [Gemmatimonadales bacterium]
GARFYPQRESLGEEEPHYEIAGERVETLEAVLRGQARVVVTTLRATLERSRMPEAIVAARLDLARGGRERLHDVVGRLARMGYERVPSVTDVAQYAVRGGIIDVYGFGMAAPGRIEWWGDEILSIRSFDLDSQRSERELERVTVLPVTADRRTGGPADRSSDEPSALPSAGPPDRRSAQSLLDVLPADTLVFVDEGVAPDDVERVWSEADHHLQVARRRGEDVPGRETVFLPPAEWRATWDRFGRVVVADAPEALDFRIGAPVPVERDMARLRRVVRAQPTLILCDNEGQLERLEEILLEGSARGPLPERVTLALGALQGGFLLPQLAVLTDHEIFRRARRIRRPRRFRQALATAASPLTPGEYVVHLEHGIGIYRGIERITVGEQGSTELEVAVIEYEGGDRLNVPLYRLDQLERYRAPDDGQDRPPPRLDRLGGTRWRRQRERTERAIRQMAAELLELYARRSVTPGYGFPPDTRWQRELESSFLYEDTPDQRTATEEVKRDMERPRPMDRLIVGDVGYGKTEVAVRAAFKAVQAGKQAAVLVPTTILAEQHGRTMRERLADFPVRVEVLSRFRSPAEQGQVVKALAGGQADIVIATHRLLSPDVTFHDLGLLIVDEEHRFGVRHKERLKTLRLQVDVLTLTATPIPRTLHQALAGLRDLTLIETPPRDRSPVLTFLEPWDDALLEEAMARELDRGGQVYFVHNRIETIEALAARVRALAPRARVAVAHGQMLERDLDRVMRGFVAGEVDVLVSTMIVESGLDVPNANTMIVHNAGQFGLAQLYQLRGRVGRGHRRAYCYLLVPEMLDPDAEARLRVLEHHTALGSGYRIALRDLELRGAGNLLGSEQSGHAHAVGVDTYLRWLDDAVRALRGDAAAQLVPPDVTLDGAAHLPDEYVPDQDAKLDLYRRLARTLDPGEITRLREELRDRFGPVPPEAERLLFVAELRALGARLGLETVLVRGDEARLLFRAGAAPRLAGLTAALDEVQFRADVRRAVPLALRLTRLGGLATAPGLVRALRAVLASRDGQAGSDHGVTNRTSAG